MLLDLLAEYLEDNGHVTDRDKMEIAANAKTEILEIYDKRVLQYESIRTRAVVHSYSWTAAENVRIITRRCDVVINIADPNSFKRILEIVGKCRSPL